MSGLGLIRSPYKRDKTQQQTLPCRPRNKIHTDIGNCLRNSLEEELCIVSRDWDLIAKKNTQSLFIFHKEMNSASSREFEWGPWAAVRIVVPANILVSASWDPEQFITTIWNLYPLSTLSFQSNSLYTLFCYLIYLLWM